MRIYIAGRYERRAELLEYAAQLSQYGHTISSKWLLGCNEDESELECAMMCLADLRDSDTLLYFASKTVTRGRFIEFGIAIGLRLKIIFIGENETRFDRFAMVHKYKTWLEFLSCEVSAATLPTTTEESVEQSLKVLESTLSEQKLEPTKTTWTYPQHSYTDPPPNTSTSPKP